MKKLSKSMLKARDELTDKLCELYADLEKGVEEFNDLMEAKFEELVEARAEKLAEVIEEAQAWCEDIEGQIEDYMSERSDNWLQSERGQEYEAWKGEFSAGMMDFNADIEKPEPVEMPNIDPETLANIPEEIGYA